MEDNKNVYPNGTRKSVTVWFKNTIEETTIMQNSHIVLSLITVFEPSFRIKILNIVPIIYHNCVHKISNR